VGSGRLGRCQAIEIVVAVTGGLGRVIEILDGDDPAVIGRALVVVVLQIDQVRISRKPEARKKRDQKKGRSLGGRLSIEKRKPFRFRRNRPLNPGLHP